MIEMLDSNYGEISRAGGQNWETRGEEQDLEIARQSDTISKLEETSWEVTTATRSFSQPKLTQDLATALCRSSDNTFVTLGQTTLVATCGGLSGQASSSYNHSSFGSCF